MFFVVSFHFFAQFWAILTLRLSSNSTGCSVQCFLCCISSSFLWFFWIFSWRFWTQVMKMLKRELLQEKKILLPRFVSRFKRFFSRIWLSLRKFKMRRWNLKEGTTSRSENSVKVSVSKKRRKMVLYMRKNSSEVKFECFSVEKCTSWFHYIIFMLDLKMTEGSAQNLFERLDVNKVYPPNNPRFSKLYIFRTENWKAMNLTTERWTSKIERTRTEQDRTPKRLQCSLTTAWFEWPRNCQKTRHAWCSSSGSFEMPYIFCRFNFSERSNLNRSLKKLLKV